MKNQQNEIDHMLESLENLYDKDPEKFENLRQKIISHAIDSFPKDYQQRARGLQFTLDCDLNRYKNPLMRMNRMVELFWGKFYEFQTAVNDPESYRTEHQAKKAKVISLFNNS